MKFRKRLFSIPLLFLLVSVLMTGCLGLENYGTLRVASGKWGATIQEVIDNWQDYDIYYAGLSYKSPSAVMFDPRKGGKRLVSDKWVPVTEQSVLKTIVDWLNSYINYPPTLWKLLGPKGDFFGYMYTSATEQVVVKQIDPDTMWVDDIPLPPFDYGGGMRGGN
ncbi:MAG: hypothetical protein H8E10_05475 [Desulfobacterales bacterium]|nr:hypothetical protein [Desulfobacterales bacterium]MBL7101973.1 hypothetical protein [Desulfobacteraceae bacterium]MBL7173369.1 hypothetical protein [Desulfobacteraceae bacterium]